MDPQGEVELVRDGEVRKQRGVLGHPAASTQVWRATGPVGGIELDAAGVGGIESGDEAQGGGLAAAGRAGQREDRAWRYVQGQSSDGDGGAERLAKVLEDEGSQRGGVSGKDQADLGGCRADRWRRLGVRYA